MCSIYIMHILLRIQRQILSVYTKFKIPSNHPRPDLNQSQWDIPNNFGQKNIATRINRQTLDYPSTAEGVRKIRSVHS